MNLTKKYTALLLTIIIISNSSCKKFLEQETPNKIAVTEIFKDFEGARTTLVGIYSNLMSFSYYLRDFTMYPDVAGGNIKYSKSSALVLSRTYNFTNTNFTSENDMNNFYEMAYKSIYSINNIVSGIDQATDASVFQKNRLLADAYTLRALVHFDLMRVFAQAYNFTPDASHTGIVIRTINKPVTDPIPPKNTAKEVYDQIVKDLDTAIVLFKNSVPVYSNGNEKTWLSENAAKALLARVCLYKEDWNRSISLNSEIINSNNYQLLSTSNYINSWSRKNISTESIFELAFGNRVAGSIGDYYNPYPNSLTVQFAATNDLLSMYPNTDIRDSAKLYTTASFNNITYYFTRKYQGRNDSANNIKIIRLSEVYLNRAEAYAQTNNLTAALADLNIIRRRGNPSASNFISTDKNIILDEIFAERRRELCFEGHLFFDISRTKRNLRRVDCTSGTPNLNYPDSRYAVSTPINQ
ncbi:MAG: RagB/SusD family nutrient uptake outer membrane protein [Chitinophagaceae bacterium]